MKGTFRSRCYWLSAVLAGGFVLGLTLPGCGPQPEKKDKTVEKKTEKASTQPIAQADAKKADGPKTEPKTEPKVEPAKPQAGEPEPVKLQAAKTEPVKLQAAKAEAPADNVAAALPPAPKVSTFAPADDLVGPVDRYVKELAKATASEADYGDQPEGKIARDANTLALIALALGLHDQQNPYKANAGAIIEASQKVAAAKDFDAAKKAVDNLQAALKATKPGELKWTKVASLKDLMEQVPLINTNLKRNLRKFSDKAREAAGNAAVLAVIAQGSMANISETKKPEEAKQWFAFCAEMRDAAAAINADVRAKDDKAATAKLDKLQKACDDCHEVFHKENK